MSDEEVVTPEGGLCTIKDCCVVICEEEPPQANPGRGAFTDRAVLDKAYDAVKWSVIEGYGQEYASRVFGVLKDLPVVYNARLQRAIGRAKFSTHMGVPRPTVIELTGSIDIPADYMHELLVHEGCHVAHCIIAAHRFAYEPSHGPRWQQLMVGAGLPPKAKCGDPRLFNVEKERERREKARTRRGGPAVALRPEDVEPGDYVSFEVKGSALRMPDPRVRVVARVIAKEQHQALVEHVSQDGNLRHHMRWRVGYGLLTKEPAP